MKRTYRWSELRKILRKYDRRFDLDKKGGKGSHRTIRHPDINGKKESYFIPCHNGDKTVIGKAYLGDIKKIFNLPDDLL